MNKILATLLLVISIALISCAPLGEKALDPMKIVVAQVNSPGGPAQAEFTVLTLKVECMENYWIALIMGRQITATHKTI